jgi:uncharacterized protein (DUF736 family)
MEYDNTNAGVLFKNDKKDTEKHPDYTGKINFDGTDMRLAAWIKEGKNGKFMSLKVSPLNAPSKPEAKQESVMDFDDSVPF